MGRKYSKSRAIFSVLLSSARKKAKNYGHQNNLIYQTSKIKGRQNYGFYTYVSLADGTMSATEYDSTKFNSA